MLMQRHLTRPSLADVMVREGILPRRTVDQVVARLGSNSAALGQTLVEEGTISEAQLAQALASQYGLPYDALTAFRVDSEFYHTISVKLMRRHPFVPVKAEAGVLTIANSDPQNLLALDELEIVLNLEPCTTWSVPDRPFEPRWSGAKGRVRPCANWRRSIARCWSKKMSGAKKS